MHAGLRSLDRFLAQAERAIALVERCKPLNACAEQRRLSSAWASGRPALPEWHYAAAPDLSELRRLLDRVVETVGGAGPWGGLYADRARELGLEAAAAEAVGTCALAGRAAERYGLLTDEDAACAEAWAELWWQDSAPRQGDASLSDDEGNPQSLLCALRREVGRLRLPFRVVVVDDLPAAAATGDGVIAVRPGVWLGERDVARIVVHEIEGHALPRQRARAEACGLFRVGTAGGSDDEEGRALLIERRSGRLDAGRRATLAHRHLAARCVRQGADFVQTVRLLRERGAELTAALTHAARVHRGGGLAREIVYLPALSRVSRALDQTPELESLMARGRIGVSAGRRMLALGSPPERIPVGADGLLEAGAGALLQLANHRAANA